MAIFTLILFLLTHCSSFGAAAAQSAKPTAGQSANDRTTLMKAFRENSLALEKEGQASTLNFDAIEQRFKMINDVIYKMGPIDGHVAGILVKQRKSLIEKIIQEVITHSLTMINKISHQDFVIPNKTKQFQDTINQAFIYINKALDLMQIDTTIDKKQYTNDMSQFTQHMHNIFILTTQEITQQCIDKSQLEKFKSLVEQWIDLQEKINKIIAPSPAFSIYTFENELRVIDQCTWPEDVEKAAQKLDQYLLQGEAAILINQVKTEELMKSYQDYLAKFERLTKIFPQVPSGDELIYQKELIVQKQEFEQRIYPILFKAILIRIEEINKFLSKLAAMENAYKYQEMKSLSGIQRQSAWPMITALIQEISILYYKYNEHLDIMVISPENRQSLIAAYDKMSQLVRNTLSNFETIKNIPIRDYGTLTKYEYDILSMFPKMYGRILGQYAIVTRILSSMGILKTDPETILYPFKKTQKEIGDITDIMEPIHHAQQSNIKAAAAAAAAPEESDQDRPAAAAGAGAGLHPVAQENACAAAGAGEGARAAAAARSNVASQQLLPQAVKEKRKAAAAANPESPLSQPENDEVSPPRFVPPTSRRRPAAAAAAAAESASPSPHYSPAQQAELGFKSMNLNEKP